MKRLFLKLLAALMALALAALGLALLPAARRQAQLRRDARAVAAYRRAVEAMDPLESGTQLARARSYNATLSGVRLADPFAPDANRTEDAACAELLDPCGDGVMAVLEIPKLGAALPVRRGASAAALETGVCHVPGTGLPTGDGAACVLAAEDGTKAARLFEDLDRLISGDCFYIRTLRETLAFQVERTVAVDAAGLPRASLEGDVCVLMTRAPGDQRLLALARRIPLRAVPLRDDTRLTPDWTARLLFAAPTLLAGLALLAAVETIRRAAARRRLKRMKL